jgi:hypothetical protein
MGDDVTPLIRAEAETVVSELVSNAVVHGVGTIRLVLDVTDDAVRGEVVDEGVGFELEVRDRGVEAVGGRGLRLVGTLARRWGIHDGSSHVWFEIALGHAAPGTTPPEIGEESRPDELA